MHEGKESFSTGELRVLSRRGDECATLDLPNVVVGDLESLAAVREAERMFHEARVLEATDFMVKPDHSIERMGRFDRTAEQMILVPRVVGGRVPCG